LESLKLIRRVANSDYSPSKLARILQHIFILVSRGDGFCHRLATRGFSADGNRSNDGGKTAQCSGQRITKVASSGGLHSCAKSAGHQIRHPNEAFAEREKNMSVIKLRSSEAHLHTGLSVALYISLQERLPSPLEVLACHKEVQELEADDFIRRWFAAEKLKQYLGSGRSILFVILNADLLKPSIQNMLLSKIQGGVSVGDTGECFLCSSLRNDWA